jgi:signal transduction histidine kinase
MGAALEAELARSRAAAAGSGPAALSAPQPVIERLIAVVERTEAGERVSFEVEASPNLRVPLAVDDLAEVLGALLENAARYARRLVRVTGAESEGRVRLVIEDDGAGIEAGRAEAALIRGGRLDEAGPGHGLGLAIVADLVRATSGEIRLERSDLGGLRVVLEWPAP